MQRGDASVPTAWSTRKGAVSEEAILASNVDRHALALLVENALQSIEQARSILTSLSATLVYVQRLAGEEYAAGGGGVRGGQQTDSMGMQHGSDAEAEADESPRSHPSSTASSSLARKELTGWRQGLGSCDTPSSPSTARVGSEDGRGRGPFMREGLRAQAEHRPRWLFKFVTVLQTAQRSQDKRDFSHLANCLRIADPGFLRRARTSRFSDFVVLAQPWLDLVIEVGEQRGQETIRFGNVDHPWLLHRRPALPPFKKQIDALLAARNINGSRSHSVAN